MPSKRAYFRSAQAKDKAAFFHFTRHTFEHGDYIRLVWQAWLEGVRVNPAFRGFGLATALTRFGLKKCRPHERRHLALHHFFR